MNLKQRIADLIQGIQADRKHCASLLPLLQRQQQLLAATDAEGLASVSPNIEKLLDALRQNARNRVRALEELGLPADQQGMLKLIQQLPEGLSTQMLDSWKALEVALAQCKALNERNGELLASQRTILAELTGKVEGGYGESE